MPETQPPWHSNIHALLLHASQPSALMLPTEHGWALLHLQRPGRMWLPHVQPIPPMLVQALARRYPDCIPAPLAIDPERNWMLLADCGRDLRSTPDSTLWTDALTAFARLQRATAGQVQDWLSLGCQDRRLEVLAAQIDPYSRIHRWRRSSRQRTRHNSSALPHSSRRCATP